MRFFVLLIGFVLLTACQQNEIEALDKAAKSCVDKTSEKCVKLKQKIQSLHDLTMELQASPQGFGSSVLKEQARIAAIKQTLRTHQSTPNQKALEKELQQLKDQYALRMIVIRWLESPGS